MSQKCAYMLYIQLAKVLYELYRCFTISLSGGATYAFLLPDDYCAKNNEQMIVKFCIYVGNALYKNAS